MELSCPNLGTLKIAYWGSFIALAWDFFVNFSIAKKTLFLDLITGFFWTFHHLGEMIKSQSVIIQFCNTNKLSWRVLEANSFTWQIASKSKVVEGFSRFLEYFRIWFHLAWIQFSCYTNLWFWVNSQNQMFCVKTSGIFHSDFLRTIWEISPKFNIKTLKNVLDYILFFYFQFIEIIGD